MVILSSEIQHRVVRWKTVLDFHRTARRYVPEGRTLKVTEFWKLEAEMWRNYSQNFMLDCFYIFELLRHGRGCRCFRGFPSCSVVTRREDEAFVRKVSGRLKLMPSAFQYKIQLQLISRNLNFYVSLTCNLQVEFSFCASCEGLGQCSPPTPFPWATYVLFPTRFVRQNFTWTSMGWNCKICYIGDENRYRFF